MIDLNELKRLTQAATPGSMEAGVVRCRSAIEVARTLTTSALATGGTDLHGVFLSGTETVFCHTGNGPNSEANAAYIVAANPQAVLALIERCERAEEALAHAYFLITGKSPEWSNLFGHAEALNEIDDAQRCLRAEADHKGTARLTLDQLYLIHALLMPGIAHGADHTESAKDQMRSVIAAAIKEAS